MADVEIVVTATSSANSLLYHFWFGGGTVESDIEPLPGQYLDTSGLPDPSVEAGVATSVNIQVSQGNRARAEETAKKLNDALQIIEGKRDEVYPGEEIVVAGRTAFIGDLVQDLLASHIIITDDETFGGRTIRSIPAATTFEGATRILHINLRFFDADISNSGGGDYLNPLYEGIEGLMGALLHEAAHTTYMNRGLLNDYRVQWHSAYPSATDFYDTGTAAGDFGKNFETATNDMAREAASILNIDVSSWISSIQSSANTGVGFGAIDPVTLYSLHTGSRRSIGGGDADDVLV